MRLGPERMAQLGRAVHRSVSDRMRLTPESRIALPNRVLKRSTRFRPLQSWVGSPSSAVMTELIYHLAEPKDWAASTDEYVCASLEEEGFIHCSTADQVSRTARQIFTNRNDLVLLAIDPDSLGDLVVYEDLYDLDEDFPHIYGPLPTTAVGNTAPYLTHLEEGLWLEETRFDPEWMDIVLHPDFTEVGMSGHTYSRAAVIDSEAHALEADLPLDGYRMDIVDEDVALVRYVSRDRVYGSLREAQRMSLWINTNEGWRLRYHQGTPLP